MKKRISFLSLCVLSSLISILALASCKGQNGGTPSAKEFDVVELKFWGKSILGKDKVTVDGKDNPKVVKITVGNCEVYTVDVSMGAKTATGTAANGEAEIPFEEIEHDKILKIKLSASGMKTETRTVTVKISTIDADDLKVTFDDKEVSEDGSSKFNTTKANGTVKITTTTSTMTKVTVDGNNANLAADGKSATYPLTVTSTTGSPQAVSVKVELKYFNPAERTFKVEKFGNEAEYPMEVVTAKLVSGDNKDYPLTFDSSKKASKTLDDIQYSTVKLVMNFNKQLATTDGITLECADQRTDQYTKAFFTEQALSGIFSGYVTHDIVFDQSGLKETEIKDRIKDKTYTEILIAGYGTVTYTIKAKGSDGKEATYTVEIVNPAKTLSDDGKSLDRTHFMKDVQVSNGHSGWGTIFWFKDGGVNGFTLPGYYKGPNWIDNNFDNDGKGFIDPRYMESLCLVAVQKSATEEFYFYYNVMNDDNNKPKNEKKFKRIKARKSNGGGYRVDAIVNDLDGKYIDCFMSGKKTLPNPMFCFLSDKKWAKSKINHGWLIGLNNNEKVSVTDFNGQQVPAPVIFDLLYNYRVQTMSYDKQNTSGNTTDYLEISNTVDFKHWETGSKINGFAGFLGGKDAANKDVFYLTPLFGKDKISKVTCKIMCGATKDACTDLAGYESVELKEVQDNQRGIVYKIGCKTGETEPSLVFKEKVYKVEVEVKYTDSTTDKLRYLIDYTSASHSLDMMDMADDADVSSNLFGVPTSFGAVKALDPAAMMERFPVRY